MSQLNRKIKEQQIINELEKPPDSAAVCAPDVLAEVIQEDSISADDFEDQKTF